jgi:hypothetical protein
MRDDLPLLATLEPHPRKSGLHCMSLKKVRRGTLVGFADIHVPG